MTDNGSREWHYSLPFTKKKHKR